MSSRAWPAAAGVTLSLLIAACGSAAPTRPEAAGPKAAVHPSAAAPTPTASTSLPAGVAYLTAWGATLSSWRTNHTPDPDRPQDYWPRLPDNRDTYSSLSLTAGRVTGYTLALDPAVTSANAKARLANDLPIDARISSDRQLPGCEQLVEQSPTMAAATGGGAVAEFEGSSGTYKPGAVSTIIVSFLGSGSSPPGGC